MFFYPSPSSIQMPRKHLSLSLIVPRVYISDKKAADDAATLKAYGITHIVRACGAVATHPSIVYHFCTMTDTPTTDVKAKLQAATAFMATALTKPTAAVLVHCAAGRSRSPTLVMAYLVEQCGYTVDAAKICVVKGRPQAICREGFLDQIRSLSTPATLPLPDE